MSSLADNAVEIYLSYPKKSTLHVLDSSFCVKQDEVMTKEIHLKWLDQLQQGRPKLVPAGNESSAGQHGPVDAPTFRERPLKHKQQNMPPLNWANERECRTVCSQMEETSQAIGADEDWQVPLLECHLDPTEGYLHTVFPSGDVLPFSMSFTLTYDHPLNSTPAEGMPP